MQKLVEFRKAENDLEVNRVILFSKKAKTPPIYKVLASEFRDRLRFAFIEAEKQEEIMRQFRDMATEFPTIIVMKTFDTTTNQTLDVVPMLKYDKKEYKLDELKEYLNQFARADKKEAPVRESDKQSSESPSDN